MVINPEYYELNQENVRKSKLKLHLNIKILDILDTFSFN